MVFDSVNLLGGKILFLLFFVFVNFFFMIGIYSDNFLEELYVKFFFSGYVMFYF